MSSKRAFGRRHAIAALIAVVAGVLGSWNAVPAAEKIRIGAILPLTGPASEVGNEQRMGLSLAVEMANARGGIKGHEVEILFEDNQAKPETSVVLFNKLVDLQKVPVIMTGYSGPSLAMAPLATRKKVLLLNGGAQNDKLATASPYLLNTVPVLKGELELLARFLVQDLKKKSAAILYQNDASGTPGRDGFRDAFTALGGKIVAEEAVPFGETNFRAALAKIGDAKPDVLFTIITQNFALLSEQKVQMKLDFTMAGNTWVNTPNALNNPATNGTYHTQFRIDAPDSLKKRFKEKFNTEMAFYSRQYYNAMLVMLAAIEKVVSDGKPVTGDNVRAAIFAIGRFEGLSGPVIFKTNTAAMDVDINVFKDGKDVLVKTLR